jgi:SOS response regulatory protein OraA/RecX
MPHIVPSRLDLERLNTETALARALELLAEREREAAELRAALITCTELARGYRHAFPTDRCAAIAAHVNEVLNGENGA